MKDIFCSYYTNSSDITRYMVSRLGIFSNDIILEPSAGEGIFVDEILRKDIPVHIDALDVDTKAISVLKKKYDNNPSVSVRETDTLLDENLDNVSVPELWLKQTDTLVDIQLDCFEIGGHYDKVIGNPPYGAWQDYSRRNLLKKKYPGQYVKETYSLFLLRCISVLKMGGRLSFIIPDTFMFLNFHTHLRELLLLTTKIDEIIIFPSQFFPGVSFGYSNLSIITLERANMNDAIENTVRIVSGFKSSAEFQCMFDGSKMPTYLNSYFLKQKDILDNPQHRFILANRSVTDKIKKADVCLGDIANIVTGFYSGDNRRFVKVKNEGVRGAKGYGVVNFDLVCECSSLQGINNVVEGYIPYIKSASKNRYYREDDEWFIRWDENTIKYYLSNKKTRFQNSSFYFKKGIGIPMVKSKIVKAFLINNRVFDQSIVGIFPQDQSKIYFLLALMNSDVVNKFIHIINPTANNSANYVKQIPYIEPDEEVLDKIDNMVKKAIVYIKSSKTSYYEKIHEEINGVISGLYDIW